MQDDDDFYIPTINSDNESGTFVDNSSYRIKMLTVTMKHYMKIPKENQMMRKRKRMSNFNLMSGL